MNLVHDRFSAFAARERAENTVKEKVLLLLSGAEGFVSGQELSEKLGISRTAVWKIVHSLQEQGYEIEAVRNRGYRLISVPDILSAETVEASARTRWAGRKVIYRDEVDSTNDLAKQFAEDGAEHGTLVMADCQDAGKGRRGRGFSCPAGCGIWMSLIIRDRIEPANASMLTLAAGLAVAQGIEAVSGLKPQIKWPNDVILDGKKVCGILTEMSLQMDGCVNYIVVGIGINVNNEEFPEAIRDVAVSISMETGKPVNRVALTGEVLRRFEDCYETFMRTQNLEGLRAEYNGRLVNRGKEVRVLDPKAPWNGTAEGINERGELLVRTADGIRHVSSGEVSVRGVYGYV